ncbi:MAG: hypothetical protein HYZ60_08430, partial [Methylocystis sp.]|nr:hypothetical protein [Methylocystis sp.]
MTDRTSDESIGEPLGSSVFLNQGANHVVRAAERRRGRNALRFAAVAAAWGVAGVAIGVGACFMALARGPISFDWLAPAIAESLSELYGPRYDFDLGAAAIANTDHGPTLTVGGLAVKMGGRTIVAAPRAELSVDLPSLLYGRLRPRRLEVLDLELRLAVMADGVIAISAGTDPPIAIPLAAIGASGGEVAPHTPARG